MQKSNLRSFDNSIYEANGLTISPTKLVIIELKKGSLSVITCDWVYGESAGRSFVKVTWKSYRFCAVLGEGCLLLRHIIGQFLGGGGGSPGTG